MQQARKRRAGLSVGGAAVSKLNRPAQQRFTHLPVPPPADLKRALVRIFEPLPSLSPAGWAPGADAAFPGLSELMSAAYLVLYCSVSLYAGCRGDQAAIVAGAGESQTARVECLAVGGDVVRYEIVEGMK